MKVKDIMTKNVAYVLPGATIAEAAQIMQKHNIGSIPVVDTNDNDNIVGIITDRDIVVRNIAHGKDPRTTPVSDVMTTNVITVDQYADIEEVAAKMASNQIRRIPVVDNNKLVGILAIGDIATDRRFDMEVSELLAEISTPSKPEKM
ncbi:MAG: CBS domain-containing protein [Clostridiaceae bacterium]|nr:CBS domain-containing protein [Clostridiaceae bacterium]